MRSLVIQHGIRLLKLRCFEAEIKARIRWVLWSEGGVTMTMKWDHCQLPTRATVAMATHFSSVRLVSGGNIQHVRVCMTGDANLDLQVYIYREVEDPRTGEVGGGVGQEWSGFMM